MVKPKIISLACEFEVENCRDEAGKLLKLGLATPEKVPGGMRDVVYKWGKLRILFKKSS